MAYYVPNVTEFTSTYPGGMPISSRSYISSESYSYGFNGMEKDDEIKGSGNSYDFGARMYDPRLMRWMAIDPLFTKYPDLTPYNFVANNPILFVDPNGKEIKIVDKNSGEIYIYKPNQTPPDGASQYVNDVFEGLNYLYNKGVVDGINRVAELVEMSEVVAIEYDHKNRPNRTSFRGSLYTEISTNYGMTLGNVINFPARQADVLTNGNGAQSAVVGLAHEIDHAWKFFPLLREYKALENPDDEKDFKKIRMFIKGTDPAIPEDVEEEDRAILYETIIANMLTQATRINSMVGIQSTYKTLGVLSIDPYLNLENMERNLNSWEDQSTQYSEELREAENDADN